MACKAENIYSLDFYRKSLYIPGLIRCLPASPSPQELKLCMIPLSSMPSVSSFPGEASLWSRLSVSYKTSPSVQCQTSQSSGLPLLPHVSIFSGTDAPSLDGAWELGEGPAGTPIPPPPTHLVSSPAKAYQECGEPGRKQDPREEST